MTTDIAAIYTDYQPRIYHYIKRRVSDAYSAEDLTSDVFVKAIDSIKRDNGPHSHLGGWLFRIARNAIIDYYRQRDHWRATVELDAHYQEDDEGYAGREAAEVVMDSDPTPYDLVYQSVVCEAVRQVIDRLIDDHRTVVLCRMDGRDFADIAVEMGRSIGATKALQNRAFNSMAPYLSEYAEGAERAKRNEKTVANIVRDVLREHGPMTMTAIAETGRVARGAVNTALYNNKDIYTVVGQVRETRGIVNVWGLVGIHDREAA